MEGGNWVGEEIWRGYRICVGVSGVGSARERESWESEWKSVSGMGIVQL